jgi:pimeloyl-ACP methyl ester carboxylesterase
VLYGALLKLRTDVGLLVRLADPVEAALDRVEDEWGTEGVGVAFWAPSLVRDEQQNGGPYAPAALGGQPAATRAMMALGYEVDWTVALPAVRVPTLVVHRSGDLVCPISEGRAIAEGNPRGALRRAPRAATS